MEINLRGSISHNAVVLLTGTSTWRFCSLFTALWHINKSNCSYCAYYIIVLCWGTWSPYVMGLRYLSLLNTKCNVSGYWRQCLVCYASLFTTSLVVTTISFTIYLNPLTLCLGAVLCLLLLSLDLLWSRLQCSLFCVLSFSVCLSLLCVLSSTSLLCVSVRLSATPQIECFHPGKKTSSPTVSFPVAAVSNNLVA
jgi:hypothetical protein